MRAHSVVFPSRRWRMADAKPIAPIRIGGTDIHYAQGMRAGPWLFFTGHEASDFERGIATVVAGKPGLPLDGQARYRREADYVLARLAKLIAAEGGDLRHIVRVDHDYPSALAVNPYQRAPNAVWNGTDIRLQSEFIITGRLKPALEAGGSSLANAIKAQVYLTDINDLPEFMDVWNGYFGANPCALTVVATKGLALLESKIE